MKTPVTPSERAGQRLGILHFGNRDFAAEIGPEPALVRIADDRADSLARGQQGARDGAADLARDTGDCIHENLLFLDAGWVNKSQGLNVPAGGDGCGRESHSRSGVPTMV